MSYGMDGWNHDNDLVRRKDVMDSIVREYNRSRTGDGLKLAWIEKAVNEVDVAQQGKIQLPEEDATKGAISDLISRAAAIDDLHGKDPSQIWDTADIEVWVNALPSAQPEPCKDAVSRSRVKLLLARLRDAVDDGYGFDYQSAVDELRDMPSAQPEIIRCKDCRYWGACPSSSATPWLHECYARIARLYTAADEFCSRAERREVSE